MAPVQLRHLEYFVAVAEEGSFSRAAARLYLTQPALSQQIQALERELGGALLDRGTRPLRLTNAGTRLLTEAQRILADVNAAARSAQRAIRGETGDLRIGHVYGGLYDTVLAILRELRRRHPGVGVSLHQLPAGQQLRALHDDEVDVVLGRLLQPVDDPSLVVREFGDDRLTVVLPTDHPLAGGRCVPLDRLADEPFVMFPRRVEPVIFDRYVAACLHAGFHPRVDYEVGDAQTQAQLVAAGFGVALSTDGLALRFPGLVYLPALPHTTITRVAVIRRADATHPLLPLFDALPVTPDVAAQD